MSLKTGSPQTETKERDPSAVFSDVVGGLRSSDIHPFDYSALGDSFVYDGKRSSSPNLLPQAGGLHIAEPILRDIEAIGIPNRVKFRPEPSLGIGRDDSRHEVFFGKLEFLRFSNSDESLRVAVKPFLGPISSRYLAQEIAMYQQIRRAGMDCPTEVGILKSRAGYFALSEFKPEIVTQDSLDWRNFSQEETGNNIGRGLDGLLELHRNFLAHGDADPRNHSVQPELSSIWHVDLEHGVGVESPEDLLLAIKADLRAYYYGLVGRNLLDTASNYEHMVNTVMEPYQTRVLKLEKSLEKKAIARLLPLVCEEFRREFEGEPVSVIERKENIAKLDKPATKKGFRFRKH